MISPAVLGFLILFNAREMCSPRQRFEFGISVMSPLMKYGVYCRLLAILE